MGELQTIGSWWMWVGFGVFVVAMLAIDMVALGRKGAHKVGAKEALVWSLVWFTLALLFGGVLWGWLDHTAGRDVADTKVMEYLTGYLLEKTLAMDNIFVFVMIFSYFAVPLEFQKRILVYGVLGAIVLRALMILLGAWLIAQFHWVLYLFGAFLLITGIKMFIFADHEPDLAKNPLLKWLRSHVRITDGYHGDKFWIVDKGVRWFTPMFLVLVLIEISDVVFAMDSIPAIFAVTSDPFIVFTSNIFAILGLRALYFLLADMADRFHLLKYGLAVVLIFVGTKMLIVDWFKIPVAVSLGVVIAVLGTSIMLSLLASRKPKEMDSIQ
ncbi:TerC family protein [Methylotenera sp.]|uniref:TerC family protein n=1 Tax=Methylotenera sp. TaxID=2051956 RepID=UPI002716FEA6|nr:TerC family protein [Methylotenera sp.]MDO9392362.1 TerC family protein [Methylotenera sp.]MDP2071471.1 TerC family protein [Methylotenera sp.]MDP3005432.1 TerC family protein [Methylotenera sp.]